jgi:Fe-Mn family superoxide dismutase
MRNSLFSRHRLIASGSLASTGIAVSKLAFSAAMQDTSAQSPADAKSPISGVPAYQGSSTQTLPLLSYAENTLEPVTWARTIGLHYGKHHRAYFYNLHKLLVGTPLTQTSREQVTMQ